MRDNGCAATISHAAMRACSPTSPAKKILSMNPKFRGAGSRLPFVPGSPELTGASGGDIPPLSPASRARAVRYPTLRSACLRLLAAVCALTQAARLWWQGSGRRERTGSVFLHASQSGELQRAMSMDSGVAPTRLTIDSMGLSPLHAANSATSEEGIPPSGSGVGLPGPRKMKKPVKNRCGLLSEPSEGGHVVVPTASRATTNDPNACTMFIARPARYRSRPFCFHGAWMG